VRPWEAVPLTELGAGKAIDTFPLTTALVHAIVHDRDVEGLYDAIVVGGFADGHGGLLTGDQATNATPGNTITNVTAAYCAGPMQNAVHICNPTFSCPTTNCWFARAWFNR
jgi:hypothetical protein